jgi:acyl dehydratase
MNDRYFEDCEVGSRVVSPGRTITETDIVLFAAFTGDWNAMHTDAEFAKDSPFGGRIAHGMLTLVAGTGLLFRTAGDGFLPASIIAIGGMDRIRFAAPVLIGDTIRLECEISDKAVMSPERGLLGLKFRVKNQRQESVVTGRLQLVVGRRPEQLMLNERE